ncbi:TetR/AcrR family transcriptional regulator [Actinoplanes sp. NPDC051513]|uniref:TetR/AcrR family transcriptional regulator n=1 Tax=Actinoplanes sp. NPDC051513 TaxID=3363908 RepID=UPI00379DC7CC
MGETQPEPGRRDRKKQQTRSALMSAALRLVDERGLDRVTVEEISAAADVSSRTFFNYFATKDDAILGDPVMEGPVVCRRLLAQPPEVPIVDAVLQVFDPAIEQIQAERELWLLRMRVIKNNPALLPVLFTRGAVEEERFVAAVAERVGVPKDHTFPVLTAALTGAAFRTAMMRWATSGTNEHLSKYVNESFALLRNGLKS